MPPSTDPTTAAVFATEVLEGLLSRLAVSEPATAGASGYRYLVSHAWTRGPVLYLVYRAVPLQITWGLARDTRQSLIDSGPWTTADEASLYYSLLDFDEGWPGPLTPEPGHDPDTVRWRGDIQEETLPARLSDLDEAHRHHPPSAVGHLPA